MVVLKYSNLLLHTYIGKLAARGSDVGSGQGLAGNGIPSPVIPVMIDDPVRLGPAAAAVVVFCMRALRN